MIHRTIFCTAVLAGLTLSVAVIAPAAQAQMLHAGNVSNLINVKITAGTLPVIPENGNILAGNFVGSSLSGWATPWVYCVDLSRNININSGPYATTVTKNGKVFGNTVNNAGAVTWLLDHYAAGATTADQTTGLQAAIWKVIYGSQFTLNGPTAGSTDSGAVTDYNNYLSGVGYNSATGTATNADSVANIQWLSPYSDSSKTQPLQGLVTAVPEPGSVALLTGIGVTGLSLLARRRRRRR